MAQASFGHAGDFMGSKIKGAVVFFHEYAILRLLACLAQLDKTLPAVADNFENSQIILHVSTSCRTGSVSQPDQEEQFQSLNRGCYIGRGVEDEDTIAKWNSEEMYR